MALAAARPGADDRRGPRRLQQRGLAPTAGGKTEAAIFPLLSRILDEEPPPVAVLYVCPIRALLNNQEERLQSLRAHGRPRGLQVARRRQRLTQAGLSRAPAHILMTTPESLEVMMISERTDARALFAGLGRGHRRGPRLRRGRPRRPPRGAARAPRAICGRDIQRIGLSATVGNPHVIGQWLQGSSNAPFRLVDPPRDPARDLLVDSAPTSARPPWRIAQLARGKKSLVFVESRAKAEKVAHALAARRRGLHPPQLGQPRRSHARRGAVRPGQNTAIVCTATMELGHRRRRPRSGHPGRRPRPRSRRSSSGSGAPGAARTRAPTARSSALSPESLLQSVALLRSPSRGWVEDVSPPPTRCTCSPTR
jgi:ATP-dependent Lhr-like helicase